MSTYCDIFKLSRGAARGHPNAPAYCGLPSLQCFSGVESERVAPAAGGGAHGRAFRPQKARQPLPEGTPGHIGVLSAGGRHARDSTDGRTEGRGT